MYTIYVCACTYIYICIYIERERETLVYTYTHSDVSYEQLTRLAEEQPEIYFDIYLRYYMLVYDILIHVSGTY